MLHPKGVALDLIDCVGSFVGHSNCQHHLVQLRHDVTGQEPPTALQGLTAAYPFGLQQTLSQGVRLKPRALSTPRPTRTSLPLCELSAARPGHTKAADLAALSLEPPATLTELPVLALGLFGTLGLRP